MIKEEEKIMNKGRIICVIVACVIVIAVFIIFDVSFDFKSFWIFRKSKKGLAINAVYACILAVLVIGIYMLIEPFTLKIQRFTFNSPTWI